MIVSHCWIISFNHTHIIHVWYIYLHLVDFYGKCIGKYTSPMNTMGYGFNLPDSRVMLSSVTRGIIIVCRNKLPKNTGPQKLSAQRGWLQSQLLNMCVRLCGVCFVLFCLCRWRWQKSRTYKIWTCQIYAYFECCYNFFLNIHAYTLWMGHWKVKVAFRSELFLIMESWAYLIRAWQKWLASSGDECEAIASKLKWNPKTCGL